MGSGGGQSRLKPPVLIFTEYWEIRNNLKVEWLQNVTITSIRLQSLYSLWLAITEYE